MVKCKKRSGTFDELDDDVKKMIYEIVQAFYDGADEINIQDILIEKKEAYFYWTGFEKEVELVKEDYGCDDEEAERIADYIRHDQLADLLNEFSQHFDGWIFGV